MVSTMYSQTLFYRMDGHTSCPYSNAIWKQMQAKICSDIPDKYWRNIVDNIASKPCGKSIWSVVRRLCFAARNGRIFKDEDKNWEFLL
ncbi:hypothetical protein Tco_0506594 [Tanacetum coccineum]